MCNYYGILGLLGIQSKHPPHYNSKYNDNYYSNYPPYSALTEIINLHSDTPQGTSPTSTLYNYARGYIIMLFQYFFIKNLEASSLTLYEIYIPSLKLISSFYIQYFITCSFLFESRVFYLFLEFLIEKILIERNIYPIISPRG